MSIIIDIKSILKSPDILAILAESVYMSTEEKLNTRADEYINNDNVVVYGYKDDGAISGLIVLDITQRKEIIILDIAVEKSNQHSGIGKKLIDYTLDNLKPNILIAETDDEAINFYRKCEFAINSLGEKYPNIIRYECKRYAR